LIYIKRKFQILNSNLEFILKFPEFKFVLFILFHILFWLRNNFNELFLFFGVILDLFVNSKVKRFKSNSEMTKLPLVPLVSPPVVEPDWAGPNRPSRSTQLLSLTRTLTLTLSRDSLVIESPPQSPPRSGHPWPRRWLQSLPLAML
jgi:hypothetical protein